LLTYKLFAQQFFFEEGTTKKFIKFFQKLIKIGFQLVVASEETSLENKDCALSDYDIFVFFFLK